MKSDRTPFDAAMLSRPHGESPTIDSDAQLTKEDLVRLASVLDVTTLSSADTPASVTSLCETAKQVLNGTSAAAVCVYPYFVLQVSKALEETDIQTAGVAGGFPDGLECPKVGSRHIDELLCCGAQEIDLVIPRYLAHEYRFEELYEWIAAWIPGDRAKTKVILSVAELGDAQKVYAAASVALQAGADMVKTSTGKGHDQSSLELSIPMLEAIRDFERITGRKAGFKAAGGVRTAENAVQYLQLAESVLEERLNKDRFRIGASALVEDLRTNYALFCSSD
ncbi:MAG: deoxyribose-phosphate aldolase [Fimbriimonadaceae bacterium]